MQKENAYACRFLGGLPHSKIRGRGHRQHLGEPGVDKMRYYLTAMRQISKDEYEKRWRKMRRKLGGEIVLASSDYGIWTTRFAFLLSPKIEKKMCEVEKKKGQLCNVKVCGLCGFVGEDLRMHHLAAECPEIRRMMRQAKKKRKAEKEAKVV